ncbi:MAG: 3-isopropylmalate dehydrogenase [Clostridiales bacterium]|nr:3-isopropylmalate dehydrogenase [Clostridiales bacterium]
MAERYKIAVIPGDGIGPEIIEEALRVLDKAGDLYGFEVDTQMLLAGGASIDKNGVPLTPGTLEICKASDAVLLGAVGGPQWDNVDPSIRPEKALLGLRSGLGLYANLRPAKLFDELSHASPIKDIKDTDILFVRELTGGIYFGKSGEYDSSKVLSDGQPEGHVAFDTETYSEGEIKRILKIAFDAAMGRSRKVTLVDKANVLTTSRLWRKLFFEMSKEYPEVVTECLYVDNCSMQLISRPHEFDVIVTSNMFGDILSDEAGMITGSVGMLPSASLGAPGTPGLFEPIHGSAPDIAGTGKANPCATILSVAMLLRYSLGHTEAADAIEKAVVDAVTSGYRTADIYIGKEGEMLVRSSQMADAIISGITR